ncbi:MAG TPA: AbrB/MazE/SpoVT family DNA-binding domain-containing protein [Allosphingosinicella sp.]|nr:AbrB/MazE/SpoVT family DNA-binding domain-containing protein [Allosphingosinicella sp.]
MYIRLDILAGLMAMKMQIGRWGNSLAVRLPRALVDRFKLQEGGEIDSAGIETMLQADLDKAARQQREEALERIRQTRWPLPPDYKFDRDEANWRPAMDRW